MQSLDIIVDTRLDILDLPLAVFCFLDLHNLDFSYHHHKCLFRRHNNPALCHCGLAFVDPSLQRAHAVERSCLSISLGLGGFSLGVEAFHCTFLWWAFCRVLHLDHGVAAPVLSNGSAWTKPEVRRSRRISVGKLVAAKAK